MYKQTSQKFMRTASRASDFSSNKDDKNNENAASRKKKKL